MCCTDSLAGHDSCIFHVRFNPQLSIAQESQTLEVLYDASKSVRFVASGGSTDKCDPEATVVGGICWHHSALGANCTDTCATHGGYDEATRTFVGDQGLHENCSTVAWALSARRMMDGGGENPDLAAPGIGCGETTVGWARFIGNPTTAEAVLASYQRACACQR